MKVSLHKNIKPSEQEMYCVTGITPKRYVPESNCWPKWWSDVIGQTSEKNTDSLTHIYLESSAQLFNRQLLHNYNELVQENV